MQHYLNLRILLRESGNNRGERASRDRRQGGDADTPSAQLSVLLQFYKRMVHVMQQARCGAFKCTPFRCEFD